MKFVQSKQWRHQKDVNDAVWCFHCYFRTDFLHFSGTSVADFGQINACRDTKLLVETAWTTSLLKQNQRDWEVFLFLKIIKSLPFGSV